MDKQYYVLIDHKDQQISWKKGTIILLDPSIAFPYIGFILTPLYSAIKAGLYHPDEPKPPFIAEVVADIKTILTPPVIAPTPKPIIPDSNDVIKPLPSKKKLLQNKLQAQILAKKAELAKNKNNS